MNWARAFFGIIIVAVGSLLLLDNLDVLDAGEIIGDWWPTAIIAGGALAFVANPRHWVVPLILVGGGALVLLRTTGVIDTVDVLLPAILIILGLLVLFGRGMGTQSRTTEDRVNTFNLFSGSEIASNSTSFRGGRIGAIFGGAEVDLRHATLAPDAELDVFAAFGGVEIAVPEGWRVEINGFPLFGGFENATANEPLPDGAPRLRIDATVLFGGIEVRH
ncbi:MAG TPA: DUF5668 domain-containing protein [Acidimicrobiia bacterium]